MNETTTYTDDQIDDWANIFGASAGMWSWWHRIEHLDGGGWDKPSRVRLVVDNPDADPDLSDTREFIVTPADIFAALEKARTLYPHLYKRYWDGSLDLDASSADVVLQVAIFGEAVYG